MVYVCVCICLCGQRLSHSLHGDYSYCTTAGLSYQSLKELFRDMVIGKIMYCAPAWHGFCSALTTCDLIRFDAALLNSASYNDKHSATVTELFKPAADALFCNILYKTYTFSTHTCLSGQN